MSEKPSIIEAFAAVMNDVDAVRKDGRNVAQNFSFRGVDAVMNAVGPALRTHGVVIVPTVEDVTYREVEVGQKRTLQRECTLRIRYTAYGPAGDHIDGVVCGEALDSGDKATAKAHSVAYRTFLLQALTIPTDEPDPDQHIAERSSRAEVQVPEGWSNAEEHIAAYERLKTDTAGIDDEALRNDVIAWVKQQGITKLTLTKALADTWESKLPVLVSAGVAEEEPF